MWGVFSTSGAPGGECGGVCGGKVIQVGGLRAPSGGGRMGLHIPSGGG